MTWPTSPQKRNSLPPRTLSSWLQCRLQSSACGGSWPDCCFWQQRFPRPPRWALCRQVPDRCCSEVPSCQYCCFQRRALTSSRSAFGPEASRGGTKVPSLQLSLPLGSSERYARLAPAGPVHIPRAQSPDKRPDEAPCCRGRPVESNSTVYSIAEPETGHEIKTGNAVGHDFMLGSGDLNPCIHKFRTGWK